MNRVGKYAVSTAITCATSLCATSAVAGDLANINRLSQEEFRLFSQDLGAAFSYKGLAGAATLGVPGFDISFALGATKLSNRAIWQKAWRDGDVPTYLPVPTLRAHFGLPFNIDIAAQYAAASSTDFRLLGGEVRWEFVPENLVRPALALRVGYSRIVGVDELAFDSKSADLSISKNVLFFTPYAGIGRVWSDAEAKGVASLQPVSLRQNRYFVGFNLNLGVNWAFEADRTGHVTSYAVKVGLRF